MHKLLYKRMFNFFDVECTIVVNFHVRKKHGNLVARFSGKLTSPFPPVSRKWPTAVILLLPDGLSSGSDVLPYKNSRYL